MNNFSKGSMWFLNGTRVAIIKAPMANDKTIEVKYIEDCWNDSGTITRKKGEKTIVFISALSNRYNG